MKLSYAVLLIIVSAVILFTGCVKEKSKDSIVNDYDSLNIAYVEPKTILINPIDSTVVLNTTDVYVKWTVSKGVIGIQYKLDDEDWSPLIIGNDTTITDLDEGKHKVTVRAKYKNGDLEKKPQSFTFNVNAVHGPSLMFLNRKKTVKKDSVFQYFVKTEEIDSINSLMGFTSVVSFDNKKIKVNSIAFGKFSNYKNYKLIEIDPFTTFDNQTGKIHLNFAFLGGSPQKGLWGTDTLFILNCTALDTTKETRITFDSPQYRNTKNDTIPLSSSNIVDGKVVVVK